MLNNEDFEEDYEVDVKDRHATLTPAGMEKAEQYFQLA